MNFLQGLQRIGMLVYTIYFCSRVVHFPLHGYDDPRGIPKGITVIACKLVFAEDSQLTFRNAFFMFVQPGINGFSRPCVAVAADGGLCAVLLLPSHKSNCNVPHPV